MKCFKCAGENFKTEMIRFTPEVKSKTVEVVVHSNVCQACKAPLLGTDQLNDFRRAAADKYREDHGLLTSQQIIQFRRSLRMSQKGFADYLGVGIASVKRWETYYIQDSSQNNHILVRCDRPTAELNCFNLDSHFSNPDIFNGMKPFSFELFKQTILFFIKYAQTSLSNLAQLNFYADFLNFKKAEKSITGTRYITLKNGPYPDQYASLLKILEHQKSISPDETCENQYKASDELNFSLFNDMEKKSLDYVLEAFQKKGQCLTALSRAEKAYSNTNDLGYIRYDLSENLLI